MTDTTTDAEWWRPEDTTAERKCTVDCWFSPTLRSLTAERDALRAQNIELQFALAETEALEIQHGAVIESFRAQLDTAEAQVQTARDAALREAAKLCEEKAEGWEDEEGLWVYPSAEWCSKTILAMIQPTPTTPRTDSATEE